jgi:hypothetical protein
MKITGYGKGWQEPRAQTVLGRLIQKMREPATTTDYIILLVLFGIGVIFI